MTPITATAIAVVAFVAVAVATDLTTAVLFATGAALGAYLRDKEEDR